MSASQGGVSREGATDPRHPSIERCLSTHVSPDWEAGETYRDFLVAINFKESPVWVDVVPQQGGDGAAIEECLRLKVLNSELPWRDGMLVVGFRYYPDGPPTGIPRVQGPITFQEVQMGRSVRTMDPLETNCMVDHIGRSFFGATMTRFVVVDGKILEATVQMSTWKNEDFVRCMGEQAWLLPFPKKKGTSTIHLIETARTL